MSAGFQAVLWNRQKIRYDIVLASLILVYIGAFFGINTWLYPTITFETMLIRSFGTLALLMLHVILSIGPLARLNKKFLVLLYNRRHFGVTMFLVASVHALFSILQFHGNGNINPILSIFLSNTHYNSFLFFPFQTLGFFAYLILMLMAFTSHDFWLSVLSPKVWKTLHILVYLAYFLLILHVLLGVIQLESSPIYYLMLWIGVVWISILHVIAGFKEWKFDQQQKQLDNEGWVYVAPLNEISNNKAKMIFAIGERVAIFKYDNKISAVHNVCKHQNGPLGEGKIVDGCITCPWHGYQYEPANGCAPAPFTEKVATYHTKIINGVVWLNPNPLPEGTYVEPTTFVDELNKEESSTDLPFYIGWQAKANIVFGIFSKRISLIILLVALTCLTLISFNQKHIQASYFTEGTPPKYEGQLTETPFPALRTINGKDVYGNPIVETYPLVNAWKFGAKEVVADFLRKYGNNARVAITGATIESEGVKLIQLDEGESSISCGKANGNWKGDSCCKPKSTASASMKSMGIDASIPELTIKHIQNLTLTGEIIDPKCYFGAMNPGFGKPHRSCAIRCIEGGVMPMLKYKNNKGGNDFAILLGVNGEPLNDKIGFAVGEPIQITGELSKVDNWKIIYLKVDDIKRLRK